MDKTGIIYGNNETVLAIMKNSGQGNVAAYRQALWQESRRMGMWRGTGGSGKIPRSLPSPLFLALGCFYTVLVSSGAQVKQELCSG